MKRWLAILAIAILTVGATMPVQAGKRGNGNGNGNGSGINHGNRNGNGNGNGNGNTDGTVVNGTTGTPSECDLTSDNWVEALDGTITAFLGNPNNEKSKQKFVMETADGNIAVNTAPWWFMQAQAFGLAVDDEVTVSGWTCVEDDETTFIAMSITKGEETIYLRDGLGHPMWSGARSIPGCGQNPDRYFLPQYEGDEQVLEGTTGGLYLDCLVHGSYPSFMVSLNGEDADGNPTVTTLVLGPQWYLEYQRFNLAADIPVMVTGVSVQVDEETFVFLVRKIETESAVLVFRDETGVPFWQTVRPLTP